LISDKSIIPNEQIELNNVIPGLYNILISNADGSQFFNKKEQQITERGYYLIISNDNFISEIDGSNVSCEIEIINKSNITFNKLKYSRINTNYWSSNIISNQEILQNNSYTIRNISPGRYDIRISSDESSLSLVRNDFLLEPGKNTLIINSNETSDDFIPYSTHNKGSVIIINNSLKPVTSLYIINVTSQEERYNILQNRTIAQNEAYQINDLSLGTYNIIAYLGNEKRIYDRFAHTNQLSKLTIENQYSTNSELEIRNWSSVNIHYLKYSGQPTKDLLDGTLLKSGETRVIRDLHPTSTSFIAGNSEVQIISEEYDLNKGRCTWVITNKLLNIQSETPGIILENRSAFNLSNISIEPIYNISLRNVRIPIVKPREILTISTYPGEYLLNITANNNEKYTRNIRLISGLKTIIISNTDFLSLYEIIEKQRILAQSLPKSSVRLVNMEDELRSILNNSRSNIDSDELQAYSYMQILINDFAEKFEINHMLYNNTRLNPTAFPMNLII
jgi:hypothetical protein